MTSNADYERQFRCVVGHREADMCDWGGEFRHVACVSAWLRANGLNLFADHLEGTHSDGTDTHE